MEHMKVDMKIYGDNHLTAPYYSIWRILKAYWYSDQRYYAYFFFALIITMTIFIVAVDVVFNYWYNYFYDALQAYNKHTAIVLLFYFFLLAALNITLAVYRFYITQIFGLRWRNWLTQQFIGRWLAHRGYYYLENFDIKTDNPDQRIQEDVGTLVTYTLDLTTGIITSISTLLAFVYVLWLLSGDLVIPLGSWGSYHIPGYLVWVSIIYSLIGTYFAFKIGHPLIGLNFEQQRREANFRFAAMDLRSHAEHVALYQGEDHQKGILHRLFGRVLDNWYLIILRQKMLLWFTATFNQTSVALPLLVALPNYFDKVFLLGGLMQTLKAFTTVQDSLSYLINSYTTIAQWRAIGERLKTFLNHIHDVEIKAKNENKLIFHDKLENAINIKNVSIFTPTMDLLLKHINHKCMHGKHYVIKGYSGIGKSTFLRSLAGIWPFAEGEVDLPLGKHLMYSPQKPYMPIGTLAQAVLFPDKKRPEKDKEIKQILNMCRLEHLLPRLHETAHWGEQLSPGEQQRIAFARVLIQKPDWLFLDECTSNLDMANEEYLYHLIKKELTNCTIISVGHRPSIDKYHDELIDMAKYVQT